MMRVDGEMSSHLLEAHRQLAARRAERLNPVRLADEAELDDVCLEVRQRDSAALQPQDAVREGSAGVHMRSEKSQPE